jgi:CubicO group peptidase (beta-lactamase class C family)
MKKIIYLMLLPAILFFSSCESILLDDDANTPPKPIVHQSEMANILDSLRYAQDYPALAAAIVTDEGTIDAQAVGCRRYGGGLNIQLTDKFQIGSCGKVFTSVLMGTLVDDGLVTWNTTLSEIFPEYAAGMRNEYRDVTVKQILSHSAGFVRDPDLSYHSSDPKEMRKELLPYAFSLAPGQQKGKYLYSNLGYIIAGAIIEKLTGSSYEELMHERVLIPLDMTTAVFGPVGTEGKEDQPLQHTPAHAPVFPSPDAQLIPAYNPAGGLSMSVEDWAKFIQWTLIVEAGGQQNLLKPGTAKMITTPVVQEVPGVYYAFGWGVVAGDEVGKTLQHSGSNGFNYSTAWLASERHYGIIIMTNQGAVGSEWPVEPVFRSLYSYYQRLYKK